MTRNAEEIQNFDRRYYGIYPPPVRYSSISLPQHFNSDHHQCLERRAERLPDDQASDRDRLHPRSCMYDLHLLQTADLSAVQYSDTIHGIGFRHGTAAVSV